MFFILYCASMCVSLSQFKIVPILGQITETVGVSSADVSWLMSVFTVAGIILAIPAGGLIAKFGPKKVVTVVIAAMICGNIIGAFSLTNFPLLLLSRVIEGCSFAFVSIAGIVFINMWYPDKNTGLFVGIFMTFASIASVIALNTALPITAQLGLVSVWWIVAGLSVVFEILFVLIVKEAAPAEGEGGPAPKASIAPILRNGRVIFMAVVAMTIGFILYFYLNNYPTVFTQIYGLDPASANLYASFNGMFGIPFCIAGGFIIDRLGTKGTPIFMIVSFACLAIACFITSSLNPNLFVLHTLLTAAFPGLILTAYNYLVPLSVGNPIQIGYGVGLVNVFYNVGIFIGSPIVLYAVAGTGSWAVGSAVLGVVAIIGLACVLGYMALAKKAASQPQPAEQ